MTTTNIQPPDIESNKIVKARRKTTQSDFVVTVIIESRGSDNFFFDCNLILYNFTFKVCEPMPVCFRQFYYYTHHYYEFKENNL